MPPCPWLGHAQPGKPKLRVTTSPGADLTWAPGGSGKPWLWLLQTRTGGEWRTEVLPSATTFRAWNGTAPDVVAVSAVSRNGELSAPSVVQARSR